MNQRFNAHDLWTLVCQEEMPELDESCMTMQRSRKFVELIAKECANVAADHDALDIYEEIREYFGVEE